LVFTVGIQIERPPWKTSLIEHKHISNTEGHWRGFHNIRYCQAITRLLRKTIAQLPYYLSHNISCTNNYGMQRYLKC